MSRDLFRLVALLLREGKEILERVPVERDAVGLLEEAGDDGEEVAVFDGDVAAHVSLRECERGRGHEVPFRDVLVHDDRELRLPVTDAVSVAVQLDVERILVKMAQIVDEKAIHQFFEHQSCPLS